MGNDLFDWVWGLAVLHVARRRMLHRESAHSQEKNESRTQLPVTGASSEQHYM